MGCKFKFFWWHLPTIIRASMFVTTCTTGFYAVVFPNYELNLVSTKKVVQCPNQRPCDRNGLPRLQEKPPVKVRHTNYGLIQLLLPARLGSCSAPRGWADNPFTILEGPRNWLSLSHIICAVFYLRQTLLRNYESCATKCRASSFQPILFPPRPPPLIDSSQSFLLYLLPWTIWPAICQVGIAP